MRASIPSPNSQVSPKNAALRHTSGKASRPYPQTPLYLVTLTTLYKRKIHGSLCYALCRLWGVTHLSQTVPSPCPQSRLRVWGR